MKGENVIPELKGMGKGDSGITEEVFKTLNIHAINIKNQNKFVRIANNSY
jgi:hypothetical protein